MYFDVNIVSRQIVICNDNDDENNDLITPTFPIQELNDSFPNGIKAVDEIDALIHVTRYIREKIPYKQNARRSTIRGGLMDVEIVKPLTFIDIYEVILHEKPDR